MARLRAGQTLTSAEQGLRAVQPQIREATLPTDVAADVKARYLATPAAVHGASTGTSALRTRYRQPLLVIMIVVAMVLLIACANLANLLLARAAARRHEFSVRQALGASRWRLARPLLAESVLLAISGALLGLILSYWATGVLVRQLSTHANTVFLDVHLNARVLAFTTAVASIAVLLFGIVPALRASRAAPINAIREPGRGAGANGTGFGNALVSGQIALSLVLVVVAALFVRTFTALATRNLGFDRDAVLIAQLDVRATGVEPTQRPGLYQAIADAARTVAGASHAAVSAITPLSGSVIDTVVESENGPSLTMPQNVAYRNVVTPDWFATYGTRLIAGRDFDGRDRVGSPLVAVVNQAFVRRFLDGRTPIGRRIRQGLPGRQGPWVEVVGVVADATYRSLREPVRPTLYVPVAQQREPPPSMNLSVRAVNSTPASLSRDLSDAVGRVDGNIAMTFTPLRQQVDAALVQERVLALLSGFFGALALVLAGMGVYGITWYAVSKRRTEIGIRMALGATQSNVLGLVLSRLSMTVLVGVAAGAAICLWASKFLSTLLYGVEARDNTTLISCVVTLALASALAGWLPARDACRTDPANVLRES
jgi:predicted permease